MESNLFSAIFLPNWQFFLLFIAILVIIQFLKMYKPAIKGAFGETMFGIASSVGLGKGWHVLNNVVIPAYDGTTQIDQIALSKYGMFVIEIKTYKGWIFGRERDSKWTQSLYREKHSFQNPLLQNYKHIRSLHEITGVSVEKIKSVIVFSGEAVFKTPMPDNVLKGTAYLDYLKSFKEPVFTENQIESILKAISDNRLANSAHREYIRNRKANGPQPMRPEGIHSDAPGFCIRCGNQIKQNAKQPYCYGCFSIWNKYRNRNYREKYCHTCGEENISSMNKPVCYNCYTQNRSTVV